MNNLNFVLGQVQVQKDDAPGFIQTVQELFEQVAGWAYIIAPSFALLLIIITAIFYMKASSQHKREEVKDRFTNIIIGLVIVFFAVQIINWLLQKFA